MMHARTSARLFVTLSLSCAAAAVAGCGPKKTAGPPAKGTAGDDWDPLARRDTGPDDGLGVTGLFEGDLDPSDVADVMRGAAGPVNGCFTAGKGRNPHLLGTLAIRVVVARDGRVREAVVEEADLGDRETERCLLDVALGLKFPEPRGGEVQMVLPLSFTPASARAGLVTRTATPLEVEALHAAIDKSCTKTAGSGYLVTVYVSAEGKPLGAGFASSDVVDPVFIDCVAAAATSVTYGPPAGVADKIQIPGS